MWGWGVQASGLWQPMRIPLEGEEDLCVCVRSQTGHAWSSSIRGAQTAGFSVRDPLVKPPQDRALTGSLCSMRCWVFQQGGYNSSPFRVGPGLRGKPTGV